ncbi:FliM/FliN family flagellar motor switch protein [Neorhizobium alkalisoli]|uniref:Flagellar motor switch protein FliN n=1 Tax=Neorhizobium alkalisoli TaxID=528178 RepID=A0A561QWS5_9HYPH|nr:FliM/FliN family flagellar motor switch protein [Neorhizobium alkalisoli]TWF54827.1 flagellar motor switch protein FliN/FliY [Neorhizobium alkalisoli]
MSDNMAAEQASAVPPGFASERKTSFVQQLDLAPQRVNDIPIEVQVVIGKTKVSVAQLMAAQDGARFRLDKHFGEPVELQVNGQVIGYGEIVADDHDNFVGIRMTALEMAR